MNPVVIAIPVLLVGFIVMTVILQLLEVHRGMVRLRDDKIAARQRQHIA